MTILSLQKMKVTPIWLTTLYRCLYSPISSGDGIKQKYIKMPNANNTTAGTSIAYCNEKNNSYTLTELHILQL